MSQVSSDEDKRVVDSNKKAINTAETIVNTLQFWRKPDAVAKRLIRKKIKTNYNTCKMLFNGFFEKVKESNRLDYFDEASMTMSKLIMNLDMDTVKKAIEIFSKHGFMLSVYKVSKIVETPTYRVVMSPGNLIASYLSENTITNGDFDAYTYYQRMNIEIQ